MDPIVEHYSFVTLRTANLEAARRFWVEQLGFGITGEMASRYFIVDAGGLRLCVDAGDDVVAHSGHDAAIGLKVANLHDALARLKERGLHPELVAERTARGSHATLTDPDGRDVILTETD